MRLQSPHSKKEIVSHESLCGSLTDVCLPVPKGEGVVSVRVCGRSVFGEFVFLSAICVGVWRRVCVGVLVATNLCVSVGVSEFVSNSNSHLSELHTV